MNSAARRKQRLKDAGVRIGSNRHKQRQKQAEARAAAASDNEKVAAQFMQQLGAPDVSGAGVGVRPTMEAKEAMQRQRAAGIVVHTEGGRKRPRRVLAQTQRAKDLEQRQTQTHGPAARMTATAAAAAPAQQQAVSAARMAAAQADSMELERERRRQEQRTHQHYKKV